MQKKERDVPLIHVLIMVGALKHHPGVLIAYANQDSLEQYAQVIFLTPMIGVVHMSPLKFVSACKSMYYKGKKRVSFTALPYGL